MDFDLTERQERLRSAVRQLLAEQLPPEQVRRVPEADGFPRDVWRALVKMGVLSADCAGVEQVLVAEEIGRVSAALAFIYADAVLAADVLGEAGTARRSWVSGIAAGTTLAATAFSGRDAGLDPQAAIAATARRDGEQLVVDVDGLVSCGAANPDWLLIVARTGAPADDPTAGLSVLAVPRTAPGVEIEPLLQNPGGGICQHLVRLSNVGLDTGALIGEAGTGWKRLGRFATRQRVLLAAGSLGLAQGTLDHGVNLAQRGLAFGRPIGQLQAPQHALANAKVATELARILVYRAAALLDDGTGCEQEAATAKFHSSAAVAGAVSAALGIVGNGLGEDEELQRYEHDAVVAQAYPVGDNRLRDDVASQLGMAAAPIG